MDYKIILIGVLSFISLLFIILTIIFISKNKKKQQKITEIINNKFNELENIYKQKEEELERSLAERYNNSINNYNL
jgi:ABC-type dipeptide/oligopeptide/nickel transport system permease component